ncbi:MAG: hypothetical protein DRI77_13110, partial [Chloroflexi bacterium]
NPGQVCSAIWQLALRQQFPFCDRDGNYMSLRAAAGGEAISYEAIWGLLRAKNALAMTKTWALPQNIEKIRDLLLSIHSLSNDTLLPAIPVLGENGKL